MVYYDPNSRAERVVRPTTAPRSTVDYSGGGRVGAGAVGTTGAQAPSTPYDPTPSSRGVVTAMPGGGIGIKRVDVPEGYFSDIFGHVRATNPNGSPRTTPPGAPPGGYPTTTGGGGGGGGGGGAKPPNMNAIYSLMASYKPQQYQWNDLAFQDYKPSKYRDFNSKQYDMMRSGLTDAIGADRASGMNTYGDLRNEYAAYQDPFSAQNQITNPAQNAAMQRMMQANGVATDINQADTNRGVQADQAFGNVLALLSGVGQQNQDARLRAVGGDERRLNERLDAEQRGGNLAVNMSEAKARDLYEQEKWQFGEQVAQQNYANRMANAQYNNQGQNQTAQSNTQMTNDYIGGNVSSIMELMMAGMASPNEMQMAATLGVPPGLKEAMAAAAAAPPAGATASAPAVRG